MRTDEVVLLTSMEYFGPGTMDPMHSYTDVRRTVTTAKMAADSRLSHNRFVSEVGEWECSSAKLVGSLSYARTVTYVDPRDRSVHSGWQHIQEVSSAHLDSEVW